MKTKPLNLRSHTGLLIALLIATGVAARCADTPSLKDAYKNHFYVGVAVNRTIATRTTVRADNVNRTVELVNKDIALVKDQFSQISPENDLKWALIHPREGADGYDFGPADAFVNFGMSNHMYIVGHTLVWHGQTPNWVFRGTHVPSGVMNAAPPAIDMATNGAGTNASGGGGLGRGGFSGPRASREELLQRMRDHIHTVVGRYKGKIKVWDVVNEAIADGGTNILRNSLWLANHRARLHRQGFRIRPRSGSGCDPPLQRLWVGESSKTPQTHDFYQVTAGATRSGHGHWLANPRQRIVAEL